MSMFENSQYRWRETYFVMFAAADRPSLKSVEQGLSALSDRYVLTNLSADGAGLFESLTLLSPDDCAALDVCYTGGQEVLEHGAALAKEMEPGAQDPGERAAWKRIRRCNARFDVLHFEQIPDFLEDDEPDEILDPSALLLVLGALARMTGGVALDPQAGSILSDD